MVRLVAFRGSLGIGSFRVATLVVCSAAVVASTSPAAASSEHGTPRQAHTRHGGGYAKGRNAARHSRHYRQFARRSHWDAAVAQLRERGLDGANASLASGTLSSGMASSGLSGSANLVAEARRYIGGNPTGRGSLWCARFMNMVLQRSGYRGTGSDMARSFASYGQRVSGPQIGAIAVMRRGGGGHVGIVSGIDARGNVMLVSGNYSNRVREAPVSRGRIYAYVVPTR
jgi:uncharacterized protein (TIGR02594 family)